MSDTPSCSCSDQRGLVIDGEAARCTTCGRPVVIPEESFQRRRWRDPDTDPEWRQFRRTREMSSTLFNEQEERRARDEPSVAEIVVHEHVDNFKAASGEQVAATFAMVDVDAMIKRQEEFRGLLPASADGSRQLPSGYGAEEYKPSMTELRMGCAARRIRWVGEYGGGGGTAVHPLVGRDELERGGCRHDVLPPRCQLYEPVILQGGERQRRDCGLGQGTEDPIHRNRVVARAQQLLQWAHGEDLLAATDERPGRDGGTESGGLRSAARLPPTTRLSVP
jgi:hypothetical protein